MLIWHQLLARLPSSFQSRHSSMLLQFTVGFPAVVPRLSLSQRSPGRSHSHTLPALSSGGAHALAHCALSRQLHMNSCAALGLACASQQLARL